MLILTILALEILRIEFEYVAAGGFEVVREE
jgi:hypothetical protein